LDQFPEFDSIRFRLDPSVTDVLPFQARGYQTSVQHTLQADCRQPEEFLWSEMRDKTRNIIRRAQDSLAVVEIDDPETFKRFYADNLDNEKSYFSLDLIPRIFAAARTRGCGRIIAAVDPHGVVHAQTFVLWDQHSYYYFLSSRNQSVAHAGAVAQLVWAGMQHAHALGLTFDFDGVTSQSRYQFLVGFGGQPATRFILSKGALLYDAQATARAFSSRLMGRAGAKF
jgi:lipid II:glycine glycyltransferase (peptidoglycan interpeptide bridge formation enzyme)